MSIYDNLGANSPFKVVFNTENISTDFIHHHKLHELDKQIEISKNTNTQLLLG